MSISINFMIKTSQILTNNCVAFSNNKLNILIKVMHVRQRQIVLLIQ